MLGRWTRTWETKGRAAWSGTSRRASEQAAGRLGRDAKERGRLARDLFPKALGFWARGSH